MVQIVLLILGVLLMLKGNLKVSDTKTVTRPASLYWGIIMIVYGVSLNFIPVNNLITDIIFYVSLLVISIIFVLKAKNSIPNIDLNKVSTPLPNTKRNTFILLGFLVLIVLIFLYYIYK